jgi:hypothetical protein
MLYHIISSFCVCGSFWCYASVSLIVVFVSNTGMFEYRLVTFSEASLKCGAIGVSCNFWSRSVVFFTLNVFSSGAVFFIFCVNSLKTHN